MNLNKAEIITAVSKRSKLDLSFDHVTTQNFLQVQPVGYRHMIKGEKINLNAVATVRPAPLAVPTYGRMRLQLRYFFVPYRVVFPNFDSFYTDVIASNVSGSSLVASMPYITNQTIFHYFTTAVVVGEGALVNQVSTAVLPAIQDPYDFEANGQKYAFTRAGARRLKILHALGYRFSPDAKDISKYNILGLLCWAKIYLDWYANSQYLNSSDVLTLRQLLKYNDPTTALSLTDAQLGSLLNLVVSVVYDGSYFSSAWDSPSSPNSGQYSAFTFTDPTQNNGGTVTNASGGTPMMIGDSNNPLNLGSQYLHSALKMLTDYSKRHQLAGAYEIDRYLAQYGVTSSALKLDRSFYLGSKIIDINVNEVTSTANTAGAGDPSTLGDYAGQAFGQTQDSIEYTSDEFGMLVIASSIMPSGGYWQGIDRNNLHISKFDVFQPEADALGVQAISKREVYISPTDAFITSGNSYNQVFGYSARYAEYKRPISFVTGDLELDSVMSGGSSWHLMRTFNDSMFGDDIANVVHSLNFTRGIDWEEYNRIFQYTGADFDKFFVDYHFAISSLCPCRSLFDSYDFEDDGRQITIDANGAKVN